MSATGPLVGITAHVELLAEPGTDTPLRHHVAAVPYVKAVARGGGLPVILPIDEPERTRALLGRVDALVVTGGCDIDPAAYGATPRPELGPIRPERDRADIDAVRVAIERDLPTLAICRGIQILNVACGGTLVQHVDDHMQLERYNDDAHTVRITRDSRLATIVATDHLGVNTLHHQAIDTVCAGLRVVARDDDGHIEAVEVDGAPNVIGVQWHPELLRHRADHRALFEWLARTAATR